MKVYESYIQTSVVFVSLAVCYGFIICVIKYLSYSDAPGYVINSKSVTSDSPDNKGNCSSSEDDDQRWSLAYLGIQDEPEEFGYLSNSLKGAISSDQFPDFAIPEMWSDLHLTDMETMADSIDYLFGEKLAIEAKRNATTLNTSGYCLRGVRLALHKVLSEYFEGPLSTSNLHKLAGDRSSKLSHYHQSPGRSAEHFTNWAKKNPMTLCVALGLGDGSDISFAGKVVGGVHLYRKGRCGFHQQFGHIEILVNADSGETCSDHCRIPDTSCGPDAILLPVASCDWLEHFQKLQDKILRYYNGNVNIYQPTWLQRSWRSDGA